MTDPIDWILTTFDGNRRRQHQEFRALPFREKLARIEEMGEVVALFAARRRLSRPKTRIAESITVAPDVSSRNRTN